VSAGRFFLIVYSHTLLLSSFFILHSPDTLVLLIACCMGVLVSWFAVVLTDTRNAYFLALSSRLILNAYKSSLFPLFSKL
jgi:hypothetical protein